MKAVNAIIVVLFAAFAFSAYLLVSKIMPKSETPDSASAPSISAKQAPSPEPIVMQQPRPQAAPTQAPSSQPPITGSDRPAMQQPAPAPAAKEEPKLRPVRDIKVVMYMTDW